jgi:copper chaperone CopZ
MKEIILDVPGLYADHHVLALKRALDGVEGVEESYLSSAWKQVLLRYDPKKTSQEEIEGIIQGSGYQVGSGEPPILIERDRIGRDPQWSKSSFRVTHSDPADMEMVGQFHRH